MVGTIRHSGEETFGCSAGCKAFVQFMRVDWRKPCISDHSFIVVSTKIFKVPGFLGACSQHNLTSSTPELPTFLSFIRLVLNTVRRKLSRINGTLRCDLAKTRLSEEQVLGAVLR